MPDTTSDNVIQALNTIAEKLESIYAVLSKISDNTWKPPREESERRAKAFEGWLLTNPAEKLQEYFGSEEYLEMKHTFQEPPSQS